MIAVLAICATGVSVAIFAYKGSSENKTAGLKAGGLDAGSIITQEGGVSRGSAEEFGPIIFNRWASAAIVESVIPVSLSKQLKVTRARIWIAKVPKHGKRYFYYLPGAAKGWPPKSAPLIGRLPDRDVTIPPHGIAQMPFGATSFAPIGTVVRINGVRVVFRQKGKRYIWTFPYNAVIHTCGQKISKESCKWSEIS
ncbi:MAG: hypothetical protein ACYDHO_05025 [Gaiellaceae bacterium]